MYVFMGHLRWKDIMPYETWFWKKNKIDIVRDYVLKIDHQGKSIQTASGNCHPYDQLIIATGSCSNTLDIEGINSAGVTGFYSVQNLEYIESKCKDTQRAVIVGGGLIGIELAEMFHSRNIAVTHLVREHGYAASMLPIEESDVINRHVKNHGIDLRLQTEISKINRSKEDTVTSVVTNSGEEIPCQLVALAIGVHPNVSWLKDSPLEIGKGILVDTQLKTNLPDIFAIGDCAELRFPDAGRKAIEPVWYAGRTMGETVAKTICGKDTKYTPGLWFNSAKFFNIEYQTYGDIRTSLASDQITLYWEHQNGEKSFRVKYTTNGVVGFNALGIRLRQEVCHQWIQRHYSIEQVLSNLELSFFDPEFSKGYADEIRRVYAKNTGKTISKKGDGNYNQVFRFLNNTKSITP